MLTAQRSLHPVLSCCLCTALHSHPHYTPYSGVTVGEPNHHICATAGPDHVYLILLKQTVMLRVPLQTTI